MDWSKEFSNICLGDKRLNQRFFKVMEAFALRPGDTIAGACGAWSAAKGAYRLLGSKRFNRGQVMEIHKSKSIERMKDHPVVLCIQDTSILSYVNEPNLFFPKFSDVSEKNKSSFGTNRLARFANVLPRGLRGEIQCFAEFTLDLFLGAPFARAKTKLRRLRVRWDRC